VACPLPEPDAGADAGELSPPDEELPDVAELAGLPDPEDPAFPDMLAVAEPEDAAEEEAPGRPTATAPAAMMLAAAAEAVTMRSRTLARFLAATRSATVCWRCVMAPSLTAGSRPLLGRSSAPALSPGRQAPVTGDQMAA
jgi:hypothetical protein